MVGFIIVILGVAQYGQNKKIAFFHMTSDHTLGRSNYIMRTFRYSMTNGQSRKFLHFCIIPINSLVNDFAGSG